MYNFCFFSWTDSKHYKVLRNRLPATSPVYRELDSISLWDDGDSELSMLPSSDEDERDELLSLLELECDDESDLS